MLLSPEELISKLLQKYIGSRNFVGITEVLTGGNPKENKMGRNLYKTGSFCKISLTILKKILQTLQFYKKFCHKQDKFKI